MNVLRVYAIAFLRFTCFHNAQLSWCRDRPQNWFMQTSLIFFILCFVRHIVTGFLPYFRNLQLIPPLFVYVWVECEWLENYRQRTFHESKQLKLANAKRDYGKLIAATFTPRYATIKVLHLKIIGLVKRSVQTAISTLILFAATFSRCFEFSMFTIQQFVIIVFLFNLNKFAFIFLFFFLSCWLRVALCSSFLFLLFD